MEIRSGSFQGAEDISWVHRELQQKPGQATASSLITMSKAGWGCEYLKEPQPWGNKPVAK
jgi:hypothetical protein